MQPGREGWGGSERPVAVRAGRASRVMHGQSAGAALCFQSFALTDKEYRDCARPLDICTQVSRRSFPQSVLPGDRTLGVRHAHAPPSVMSDEGIDDTLVDDKQDAARQGRAHARAAAQCLLHTDGALAPSASGI